MSPFSQGFLENSILRWTDGAPVIVSIKNKLFTNITTMKLGSKNSTVAPKEENTETLCWALHTEFLSALAFVAVDCKHHTFTVYMCKKENQTTQSKELSKRINTIECMRNWLKVQDICIRLQSPQMSKPLAHFHSSLAKPFAKSMKSFHSLLNVLSLYLSKKQKLISVSTGQTHSFCPIFLVTKSYNFADHKENWVLLDYVKCSPKQIMVVTPLIEKAAKGKCSPGRFRCQDDTCILDTFVCDGQQDCIDNLDESFCTCFVDKKKVINSTFCFNLCEPGVCRCHGLYDQLATGGCKHYQKEGWHFVLGLVARGS